MRRGHLLRGGHLQQPGRGAGPRVQLRGLERPGHTLGLRAVQDAGGDFVEDLPADQNFELATVNPIMVLGPVLGGRVASGSAEVVTKMCEGTLPGLARVPLNVVDVRDVAVLHLGTMTRPEGAGKRFIARNCNCALVELAPPLRTALGPHGYLMLGITIHPDPAAGLPRLNPRRRAPTKTGTTAAPRVASATMPALLGHALNDEGPQFTAEFAFGLMASGQLRDRSRGAARDAPDLGPHGVCSAVAKRR